MKHEVFSMLALSLLVVKIKTSLLGLDASSNQQLETLRPLPGVDADVAYWEWVAACSKWAVESQGKYVCTQTGNIECRTGWQWNNCGGPMCAYLGTTTSSSPKPKCSQTWDPISGYCEILNTCLCFNGYERQNCTEMISHPFCKHGVPKSADDQCACYEGWQGDLCNIPVCKEGCSSTNGYCLQPDECRCKLGWKGDDCTICTPYPGCQNGGCKKPWECRCDLGWTGAFCNEPLFSHHIVMDTEHKFNVYWSFGKKGITFKLEIESLGFVELGFSLSGGMEGADIVIAWVDDDDGEVHLTDRYGLPTDVTDRYGLSTLDKTQNLKLQLGYQNNTHTVVQFYRDWDTCDEEDVKLGHDTVRMIWGHHEKDLLQPPSHSGIRSVHLMEEMPEATQLPEHKVWDVTAGNINVPHDDKTHYFCRIVKLPDAAQISKHHIIAVEPLIQPGSDALINHMTLSECHVPDTLLEGLLDHKGSECWGPGMPPVFYYCRSIIAAWALGNPGYRIADHVGLPLGQKFGGATYYRLEVHYDNPSLMSGFVDDSGLRISYTDKLREMDMGYLFTGIAINFMHVIPPKQDQFLSSGQCSSECTQEVIPKEGVKVFQLFHHTQSAGRKIRVRHIRNGLELPLITEDNNFDYTYHGSREPTNEILILPGDTLITECEYQTDETTIHGGLSTRDEMCIVFMAYYPKSNLSECSSGPTFSTFLSSMGIEKLVGGANLEKLIDYTYHTNPSLYKFEDRINVVNNLAAEVNLDGDILELLFDKKFYEDFSHQTDVIMRILMKMKIEAPSDLSGLTVEYVTNGMDWSMRGLEMSRILNKKEHSYKCSGPQRKPLLKYTTYKAPSFTKLIKEDFCDVTNITIN